MRLQILVFSTSKSNLYDIISDVDAHSINGSAHLPDTFPIVTRSFQGTHKCHHNSSKVHFEWYFQIRIRMKKLYESSVKTQHYLNIFSATSFLGTVGKQEATNVFVEKASSNITLRILTGL